MWPRPNTWLFGYFIVLLLLVYLIFTETQSQACKDRLCYNTTASPSELDTKHTMVDKMITTLRVNHNPVEWRKALLIGLVVAFVAPMFFGCALGVRNFIMTALLIFIVIYFIMAWHNWTVWREVDVEIERELFGMINVG